MRERERFEHLGYGTESASIIKGRPLGKEREAPWSKRDGMIPERLEGLHHEKSKFRV
jgi:hypothetical protein